MEITDGKLIKRKPQHSCCNGKSERGRERERERDQRERENGERERLERERD